MFINKDKLKRVINDPDRKPFLKIFSEATKAGIIEKELPRHYFSKFLYRKDISNYLDYIGSFKGLEIEKITENDNSCLAAILDNKVFFNYFFKNKGIAIPVTIGFNYKNSFIKGDSLIKINSFTEFNYLLKNWSKDANIFIKPIDGAQGKECHRISRENNYIERIKTIYDKIILGNYIFQETIEQDCKVSEIFGGAVNILRIGTYFDDNSNSHIISSFMTFGIDCEDAVNNNTGGIFVPVDFKEGVLKDVGFQYLENGRQKHKKHPKTNFVFEGFEIPYFKESMELIKKALEYLPAKLVGWDIAITKNGPLLIEGNSNPSMMSLDISYGGLKKHPVFKNVIKEFY